MYDSNFMEAITVRNRPLNRWDKDSIRPGPVGSVGDVNLQVKLKKSADYLPNRYDSIFSGKNEVWSGSNISDGQWTGFTSGGRGALTLSQPLPYRHGFKTAVGTVIENIIPVDRSRIVKSVPLGQYDWESKQARIYKAKVTGEQFLPLPGGYSKPFDLLPRGSHYPQILAESTGTGTALPAAEVKITDPEFGENGSIEVPGAPLETPCEKLLENVIYAPKYGTPAHRYPPPKDYPYRFATYGHNGEHEHFMDMWPNTHHAEDQEYVYNIKTHDYEWNYFDPCGALLREFIPRGPSTRIPKPGDNRPRPEDPKKEREGEKKKKQLR